MSLIDNAIDSIEMGVEDFNANDARRASAAVRNFFAGVLLLLKEKLRQESPAGSNDALIYERIEFQRDASGAVIFVGKGKKTVDVEQIKERFRSLKLSLDEKPLDELRQIRNDVEHHSSKHSLAKTQEAIAKTFVLVTRVLEDHLELKPNEVFSKDVWKTMLDEAQTFNDVQQRCRTSLTSLQGVPAPAVEVLEHIECPECGSPLMEANGPDDYVDATFTCRLCGEQADLAQIIPDAADSAHKGGEYERMKEGEPHPIGTCPHCNAEAFDRDHDVCMVCTEGRQYTECDRCTGELGLDEQETGLCSYCQHVYEKVMAE